MVSSRDWTPLKAGAFMTDEGIEVRPLEPFHHNRSVETITLPSGRTVELTRFHAPAKQSLALHVCRHCGSKLVEPVAWREREPGQWQLTLRCPECRRTATGVYPVAEVEHLDQTLNAAQGSILADLYSLSRANMAADVEQFIGALRADLVLPEDF
jgi:DNA-directed RNA polymerase subunit RPC12/RpoP